MVNQIINFIVAVDESCSILRLSYWLVEKGYHVVEMGYLANGDLSLNIDGLCLRFRDGAEGFELTVVEAS